MNTPADHLHYPFGWAPDCPECKTEQAKYPSIPTPAERAREWLQSRGLATKHMAHLDEWSLLGLLVEIRDEGKKHGRAEGFQAGYARAREDAAAVCDSLDGWRAWTPLLKERDVEGSVSPTSCDWAAGIIGERIRALRPTTEEAET